MRNMSLAVLVMNADCFVVACSYDKNEKGEGIAPFTLFKTFNKDLKKGDLIIVPTDTRYGYTAVRVEEVNVAWNPTETRQINWVAGVLDTAEIARLREMEKKGQDVILAAEKRKQREELTKSVTEHMEASEVEALKISYNQSAEAAE